MDHIEYNEGIPNNILYDIAHIITHWKNKVEKIIPATKIDENKCNNLIKRREIYGDIMQEFTDEDIKEALLKTKNFVPLTFKILTDKRGEKKFFQLSEFIENE